MSSGVQQSCLSRDVSVGYIGRFLRVDATVELGQDEPYRAIADPAAAIVTHGYWTRCAGTPFLPDGLETLRGGFACSRWNTPSRQLANIERP